MDAELVWKFVPLVLSMKVKHKWLLIPTFVLIAVSVSVNARKVLFKIPKKPIKNGFNLTPKKQQNFLSLNKAVNLSS